MKDCKIDVEKLYIRYGPMVLRRCRQLLKDEDLAYEALQEVFLKLIRSQRKLEGRYPSSLLYTMATNMSLNLIRKRRPVYNHDESELVDQIAFHADYEKKYLCSRLIDTIFKYEKASTREVAVRYYVDGLTYKEISNETGLSESGIRKKLKTLKLKFIGGERE